MAHSQKPDFVFRRNGRVHLNRPGDVSSVDYWHSRYVRISGSNAGYTVFRGSVKGTGYPLHSPVSPSLPLPCVTVCHHISTGVYHHETNTVKDEKGNVVADLTVLWKGARNTCRYWMGEVITPHVHKHIQMAKSSHYWSPWGTHGYW
jgi:hypothetical protein